MRPTEAIVNLDAIRHNLAQIRRRVGRQRKVLAAVKADAYGHGLVPVARACAGAGADMLGVATIEEALELRHQGIECPILTFISDGPDSAQETVNHRIAATVYNQETALALSRAAREAGLTAKVHLNVDTGMGRGGLEPKQAPSFAEQVAALQGIELEGVWTHFPVADCDQEFTAKQIELFVRCLKNIGHKVGKIPIVHAANSAAVLRFPSSYFDMVRCGIAVYGLEPFEGASKTADLVPALTLRSRIICLKQVPSGWGISYGRRFITQRPSRIATVPIGYADGYSRSLSGKAQALVHGQRVPVVGTICMDQLMLDVTSVPGIERDDEVILVGRQGSAEITAEELAGKINTINYEIVCRIGSRVPRVYLSTNP